MAMTVGAPDYNDIKTWGMRNITEDLGNKTRADEWSDGEIGPDVRYALNSDDIDLVEKFIKSPITTTEYRELRHKLLELKGRQLAGDRSSGFNQGKVRRSPVELRADIELYGGIAETHGSSDTGRGLHLLA